MIIGTCIKLQKQLTFIKVVSFGFWQKYYINPERSIAVKKKIYTFFKVCRRGLKQTSKLAPLVYGKSNSWISSSCTSTDNISLRVLIGTYYGFNESSPQSTARNRWKTCNRVIGRKNGYRKYACNDCSLLFAHVCLLMKGGVEKNTVKYR